MVDASTFCCIDYVVHRLPGKYFRGPWCMVPWEIRKVGLASFGFEDHGWPLSFGKILAPPPVCSSVFTLSPIQKPAPSFFVKWVSIYIKQIKMELLLLKEGGDGNRVQSPFSSLCWHKLSLCGTHGSFVVLFVQLLSCVVVQLLSCAVVQLPSQV